LVINKNPMNPPPLCLYELHFRVISPIDNLPFYHGPQLSALFRYLIKPHLSGGSTLSSTFITIEPIETGLNAFEENDIFNVGIAFPIEYLFLIEPVIDVLSGKNKPDIPLPEGHLMPGKTIILDDVVCRISGKSGLLPTPHVLNYEILKDEFELLKNIEEFSLVFHSPLRLPRPHYHKIQGHRYCDYEFFLEPHKELNNPLAHVLSSIKKRLMQYHSYEADKSLPSPTEKFDLPLKIADGALIWIDCPYGYNPVKTIGGVMGTIKISGRCTDDLAQTLVMGQYSHLGKNTAFGFGSYIIPELEGAKRIKPLCRGKPLFERAITIQSFKNALSRLPNSSPGMDGITLQDAKKAGEPYLINLRDTLFNGTYIKGELKRYRLLKNDGKFRDIYVQCISDRLIHKVISDYLSTLVDRLLHDSAWAYRKGLNRKGAAEALQRAISEGYVNGIKADIDTFFDSINLNKLFFIIEGLFPFEPLTELLKDLIDQFSSKGVKGLPQGSPLSPVLSNLYLTLFDKDMEKEGFRLTRYCDDFVILSKSDIQNESIMESIQKSLFRLDLTLKKEKTIEVQGHTPINFLGYLISNETIEEGSKEENDTANDEWLPVFKDEWRTGQPVYITMLSKGAYSSGPDLFIKLDEKEHEKINWNNISRLVVVGRSPVSGGVIYRAVKEEIPVTFIDIMGKVKGSFYPEYSQMSEIASIQATFAKDEKYSLSFAKEIISAKVHNSFILLKRNGIDSKGLKELEKSIREAGSVESLRGYEGTAARLYFSEFAHLVEPFEFKGRVYHPPDGPVNVMLSFGYTLLYNRISAVLKDKGFNARTGFFHKGRGTHNALASDLLEELRHIVERIVLTLIHLKEIKKDDFSYGNRKGVEICRLEGDGFRKFIRRFENTMAKKASYHGAERMSYNSYLDEMSDSLKRSLKLNIPYKALRID